MIKKQGKTLADLRAAHDKNVIGPARIREALAALAKSGDEWAYEPDFMALIKPGISSKGISVFRDQFKDFWADLPTVNSRSSVQSKRVWFVSKKLADKWKDINNG